MGSHSRLKCFLGGGGGGHLFEGGRLFNFWTSRVGAYSRWALIRGWALNRINTVLAFVKVTSLVSIYDHCEMHYMTHQLG